MCLRIFHAVLLKAYLHACDWECHEQLATLRVSLHTAMYLDHNIDACFTVVAGLICEAQFS